MSVAEMLMQRAVAGLNQRKFAEGIQIGLAQAFVCAMSVSSDPKGHPIALKRHRNAGSTGGPDDVAFWHNSEEAPAKRDVCLAALSGLPT